MKEALYFIETVSSKSFFACVSCFSTCLASVLFAFSSKGGGAHSVTVGGVYFVFITTFQLTSNELSLLRPTCCLKTCLWFVNIFIFLQVVYVAMEEGICKPLIPRRIERGLLLWTLLLLFLQSSTCNGQCSNSAGCFPPVGNIALGRTVGSTSTCSSGSQFCIFGLPSADCFPCNPNTTHSLSNINDNNNGSVWLSEIGSSSNITLQLDFEAPILFERTVLVWQSARPQSMVLERSHDNGETWIPYRYYSASCNSSFMLPNTTVTSDTVLSNTEAICTNVESRLFPVTNALVSNVQ